MRIIGEETAGVIFLAISVKKYRVPSVLAPIELCVKSYGMHQCFLTMTRSRFTPCMSMEGDSLLWGTANVFTPV